MHRRISESCENQRAAIMKRKNSEITVYRLSFRIFLLEGRRQMIYRADTCAIADQKKKEFIPLSLLCKQVYRHTFSCPSVHEGCWYVTTRSRERGKLQRFKYFMKARMIYTPAELHGWFWYIPHGMWKRKNLPSHWVNFHSTSCAGELAWMQNKT